MNRRDLIGTALACGAMQAAQRPRTFERVEACVPDTGIVDWTPDVLHPVSFGYEDYSGNAPMPLRIYYPSYSLARPRPPKPLLKRCDVRWPLVLFLHGRPPCFADVTEPDYFLRWQHFAALLAKSGYIVAVPSYEAPHATEANHPTIARAMSVIDWVRGLRVESTHPGAATARRLEALTSPRWENADWVHPRATAIVGHSFGATLAARIAHARPSISSYVSLSGPFALASDLGPILQSIQARKLFMWAPQAGAEDLDQNGIWGRLPQPKHAAFLPQFALGGLGHFDYIAGPSRSRAQCGEDIGSCLNLRTIAANLTALFIARHTPVGAAPGIPVSLIPPNVTPTPRQKTFGRALLSYTRPNRICPITVRWETPEESGARILERPE